MVNKQRSLGVVLQYVQMALSILISLIYTPIMIRILGQNEYGIYNLASSIIAYLTLISLGFGSSYIRYYSIYKKGDNKEGLKKLNGLYFVVFLLMGIIALICGLFLTAKVNWFYNDTYTVREIEIARVLMFFLTVNLALSFPMSVFTSYITSQERFVFQKLLNMGKTVFSPVVNIILLYLGYGSIGMVVASTAISIVVDLINIYYCFHRLDMQIGFRKLPWGLIKSIFGFSVFIAINQVIDQINWQTDKVILGKMINGAAVAVYAVGANINTMYINFSTAVSSVFAPKIHRIVNSDLNENEKNSSLTSMFINVGRVQFFILALILSGFIFFGKYFVLLWVGEQYTDAYYVALLLICPITITLIQNLGIEIQRAKNKHQFRSIVYLIMALLNVFISIWFCVLWGVIGVAIGTTISLLVANGLIMNIYYHKNLGIDVIKFWKSILGILPSLLIPIVLGIVIKIFYQFHSWWDFILFVILYSVVYIACIVFLGLNKTEKELVFKRLKKNKR